MHGPAALDELSSQAAARLDHAGGASRTRVRGQGRTHLQRLTIRKPSCSRHCGPSAVTCIEGGPPAGGPLGGVALERRTPRLCPLEWRRRVRSDRRRLFQQRDHDAGQCLPQRRSHIRQRERDRKVSRDALISRAQATHAAGADLLGSAVAWRQRVARRSCARLEFIRHSVFMSQSRRLHTNQTTGGTDA